MKIRSVLVLNFLIRRLLSARPLLRTISHTFLDSKAVCTYIAHGQWFSAPLNLGILMRLSSVRPVMAPTVYRTKDETIEE